ncbi:hypothetical protein Tco_0966109 [Tanacetum coccineum]
MLPSEKKIVVVLVGIVADTVSGPVIDTVEPFSEPSRSSLLYTLLPIIAIHFPNHWSFDLGRLIKFVHTRIASVAIRDVTACVTSESRFSVNFINPCASLSSRGISKPMRVLDLTNLTLPSCWYREYDLAHLKLVLSFVFIGSGVGVDTAYPRHKYAVSSLMDTAYWLSER